jgi:exportin-7
MGTKTPEQAKVIVMLARNLKGVCLAATSAEHYNVVFKYLVENPKNVNQCKIGLFSAAADVWWDEPEVVVPVLKFIAEFAHNKAQRIVFEANSPNGIVLFREATKVLSAYGQRMLQRPASFAYKDIYEEKYKGIGAALSLLTNTLGGNYANLGVFELYGDNTLQVAMGTALALCLSVPLNDLSAFLKSLKPVYTFLEIVTKSHMSAMVTLSTSQFSTILRALEDGLTAFDTAVALSACTAMDHICTYLLETKDGAEEVAAIQAHLASVEVKNALSRQLAILNHLSTSGEFASTWSLSRPFLGLILLEKNAFLELRQSVVQQQLNAERRQLVENAYNELMQGVNDNMSTKNRELFTKNLYQFGITLRSK